MHNLSGTFEKELNLSKNAGKEKDSTKKSSIKQNNTESFPSATSLNPDTKENSMSKDPDKSSKL